MKVALLGAQSTGKSHLAVSLATHLSASGLHVHRVDEYLREWFAIENRAPTREEQHHIAQTQIERVLAAPAHAVVIADTTPLMTAVYSQMVFNDQSLDALALAHQTMFDITLLMGMDLPWTNDGRQQLVPHMRETSDKKIRTLLGQTNRPYQVVYGTGEQRLANALYCIGRQTSAWAKQLLRSEPPTRWSGPCETCGDGSCEHRLFTGLLTQTTNPSAQFYCSDEVPGA